MEFLKEKLQEIYLQAKEQEVLPEEILTLLEVAFQKPPPSRRLLKGLVHQRTGTQLPRDQKRKRTQATLDVTAYTPQVQASLRCRLPSRPGPPEAQQHELSVCAMAVLWHRRGLWGSELTSRPADHQKLVHHADHQKQSKAKAAGLSEASTTPEASERPGAPAIQRKAWELGACPLRHQAFQKPPQRRRLLKGLVHQRSKAKAWELGACLLRPGAPAIKRKAWELGACPLRHQAFQKPLPRVRLLKGLVHQRSKAKAWELGACPLRHQAFQKPSQRSRLLKGLVHQRSKAKAWELGACLLRPGAPAIKRKAWELGACPLRHQAFQKSLPRVRLLKGLVHQRSKAKAWELGACPLRHQAFQKPLAPGAPADRHPAPVIESESEWRHPQPQDGGAQSPQPHQSSKCVARRACLRSPPVSSAPQLPGAGSRHRQASDGGCPAAQGRLRLRRLEQQLSCTPADSAGPNRAFSRCEWADAVSAWEQQERGCQQTAPTFLWHPGPRLPSDTQDLDFPHSPSFLWKVVQKVQPHHLVPVNPRGADRPRCCSTSGAGRLPPPPPVADPASLVWWTGPDTPAVGLRGLGAAILCYSRRVSYGDQSSISGDTMWQHKPELQQTARKTVRDPGPWGSLMDCPKEVGRSHGSRLRGVHSRGTPRPRPPMCVHPLHTQPPCDALLLHARRCAKFTHGKDWKGHRLTEAQRPIRGWAQKACLVAGATMQAFPAQPLPRPLRACCPEALCGQDEEREAQIGDWSSNHRLHPLQVPGPNSSTPSAGESRTSVISAWEQRWWQEGRCQQTGARGCGERGRAGAQRMGRDPPMFTTASRPTVSFKGRPPTAVLVWQ
ncbi:hypothetical protein QTO34_017720 [Cnephaeus nilssonii]|uniref:Uncharacterized protein n=1 Tax=Cnephaeus nilssonii TaxID=3371016 RepID=A0AA40I2C6_CNENI|nr:hypothetical protein QTO34_017720 [Eptesicus nilssonii]